MRGRTSRSEIVEAFARILRDAPDRRLIHVPTTATSVTADDLRLWCEQHCRRFDQLGLGSDHLLVSAVGNRPEAFALWLACRTLGIALMPVDSGTTISEIDSLARRFGASVTVLPEQRATPSLGRTQPFAPGLAAVWMDVEPAPQVYRGAAVLKLTSGSTGLPKATFTTEQQLISDVAHITEAMDIRPDDCQIAAIPLSHAYGIGNLVLPLLVYGTSVVLRDGFVPQSIPAGADTFGARIFPGVPYMFEHLIGALPHHRWPASLRILISAGARLETATQRSFHDAFGLKIHSFYGASETGGIAYDDSDEIGDDATVGRAMPRVTITLKPEEGAPPGCGRVHVSGEAVATGYANDRAHGDFTDGGFLTGDFGRFDARHHLILTGRVSSFINVAGRKVQPEEVEQVLRSLEGVVDVRVMGAPDPIRGEQVVACIVTRADAALASIRQRCASQLAPHKIPRAIIRLSSIPLNERGKTDRARLEALVREHLSRTVEDTML